ncbi:uncharacterized protein TNIN_368091 [Trichonephila inaurata madagascariensis]|uniref:Fibronectin type-III domain-containing protein n=1 Tax=Trichonephila inaurata madagascariensis TaxID=2747483 RepID=A0A8X6WS29_9ARAC|nr:uncharacterized protein TNIN_368091 [Trichonephila inaurata madagascariensis]
MQNPSGRDQASRLIHSSPDVTKAHIEELLRVKYLETQIALLGKVWDGNLCDIIIYFRLTGRVPEEPKNCQVTNRTSDCIYLGCESGEDGGLQQIFQIEVMSTDSDKFLANLTARNSPNFIVCSLPPKESFILVVYAINSKGRSKQVTIHTSTLPGQSKEKGKKKVIL